MNIEHKTTPIEHWIVDGKAYRMATADDVGKIVYRSDISIERAMEVRQEPLASVGVNNEFRFVCRGFRWKYAYVQDDSLLTPQRTLVPALGDGWFLLTAEDGEFMEGDKISSDGNRRHWVSKSWPTHIKIGDWLRHDSECRAARYFGHVKEPESVSTPTTKPIDWTKPVRTKDGRDVRVLCTDGPGEYPVIGILDGVDGPECWHISGSYFESFGDDRDLENAPQRIQREYWVNMYPEGAVGGLCSTKEAADGAANDSRLACVKITIDCEEGEGL